MKINYNGVEITVHGGAWLDIMNCSLYKVIDHIDRYDICKDQSGVIFAIQLY